MARANAPTQTRDLSPANHGAACLMALLFVAAKSVLAGDIGTDATSATTLEPSGPARRIVISIPDRKLALVEDGEVRKVYDVAVGARVSPSPIGRFKIINRIVKPNYYGTGTVVPPGKNNPLGTRWLGLNKRSYGIHGTNVPRSIGKAASHGCIRMRNRDVEELFELVRPGDGVEIVVEKNEQTARLFNTPQAETTESKPAPSAVVMAAMAGSL